MQRLINQGIYSGAQSYSYANNLNCDKAAQSITRLMEKQPSERVKVKSIFLDVYKSLSLTPQLLSSGACLLQFEIKHSIVAKDHITLSWVLDKKPNWLFGLKRVRNCYKNADGQRLAFNFLGIDSTAKATDIPQGMQCSLLEYHLQQGNLKPQDAEQAKHSAVVKIAMGSGKEVRHLACLLSPMFDFDTLSTIEPQLLNSIAKGLKWRVDDRIRQAHGMCKGITFSELSCGLQPLNIEDIHFAKLEKSWQLKFANGSSLQEKDVLRHKAVKPMTRQRLVPVIVGAENDTEQNRNKMARAIDAIKRISPDSIKETTKTVVIKDALDLATRLADKKVNDSIFLIALTKDGDKVKIRDEAFAKSAATQFMLLDHPEKFYTNDFSGNYYNNIAAGLFSIELTRLRKEYLLRELASKSFLPGYGFPTDVVNFDNNNIEDYIREKDSKKKESTDREDNISRVRGLPSRNLAVAIREYAPGAEIVLDGRVFKSGGISLNWHNIADSDAKEAQKFDLAWRCDNCGQTGYMDGVSVSHDEVYCDNPECHKGIKPQNQLKVLQPTGFVADFYETPSNDITTQSYIPIEPAWVSVAAEKVSLPNESMGHMLSGPNGTVFNHTSGAVGQGYALCLTCGRAESLDVNGDYPKGFNPEKPHRPLRASKTDKDGYGNKECEGAATLMKGVHLGCHVKTDVFELILKHPRSNEYIPDNHLGNVIAITLAVALRSALAEQLGISTSEVGYACRPSIIQDGQAAMVIQLFDSISGGAGFASSAPNYIKSLIDTMVSNLGCSKCESCCGDCLLESDSKRDVDNINRLVALEWLGDKFCDYNGTSEALNLLENGIYYPGSIAENIRYNFDHGAHSLTVWLNNETDEWDLTSPNFRKELIRYLTIDDKIINVVLPEIRLADDVIEELVILKNLGANFYQCKYTNNVVVAQLENETDIVSLANSNSNVSCPGDNWHRASGTVVVSYQHPKEELHLIDDSFWDVVVANAVNDVELTTQLNGNLSKFGEAFWVEILKGEPQLLELIAKQALTKVHYSDRYLQSPSSLLLITQLLSCICTATTGSPIVEVETLFHRKDRPGYLLHHDWQNYDDFVEAFEYWIEFKSKIKPSLVIHEQRSEIAHKRKLTLEFDNGKTLICRLDQGIGYWQLSMKSEAYAKLKYDFNSDIQSSFGYLKTLDSSLSVKNSEQWSTDISYKLE